MKGLHFYLGAAVFSGRKHFSYFLISKNTYITSSVMLGRPLSLRNATHVARSLLLRQSPLTTTTARGVSSLTRLRARRAKDSANQNKVDKYVSNDPGVFRSQVAVFDYSDPAPPRDGAWRARKATINAEQNERFRRRWNPERVETTRKRLRRHIIKNKGPSLTEKNIAFTSAEILRFDEKYFAEWSKAVGRERKGKMTPAKGQGKRSQ